MSTTISSPNDLAAQWRDEEAAVRAMLAAPGIIGCEKTRAMSGLEVFAAIRRGELPTAPISHLLGFVAIEFEKGRFVFQGTPRLEHYNPIGSGRRSRRPAYRFVGQIARVRDHDLSDFSDLISKSQPFERDRFAPASARSHTRA